MRTILALLIILTVALPLTAAKSKPNLIVIFTDDHGWADHGAQGVQQDIRTPHLDAQATGGLRATSGYVTAPQCVPSRAGLFSGRYQNRFGVESNGHPIATFNVERTIAEHLQQAGYATVMVGKWHLGSPERTTDHGFDRVFFKHSNAAGSRRAAAEDGPRPEGQAAQRDGKDETRSERRSARRLQSAYFVQVRTKILQMCA